MFRQNTWFFRSVVDMSRDSKRRAALSLSLSLSLALNIAHVPSQQSGAGKRCSYKLNKQVILLFIYTSVYILNIHNLHHGSRARGSCETIFLYQTLGEGRAKHVAREKFAVKNIEIKVQN